MTDIQIARDIPALRNIINDVRILGRKIAFVPTMGALHDGHISLVKLAQRHAHFVIVSIFVNPTQFAPHEDFNSYPRSENDDVEKLHKAGANAVFLPSESVMYSNGKDSKIKAGHAAEGLETDFRPHFFDGVVNIVHRLFEAVKPDIAIFGEKDFQQLQVIKEMVQTQDMPIQIIGAPIARDEYGLALSSRNAYLSSEELEIARKLNKVLFNLAQQVQSGEEMESCIKEGAEKLLQYGFDKVDYIAFKLEWNRLLAAAWLGKTRLIDNVAA